MSSPQEIPPVATTFHRCLAGQILPVETEVSTLTLPVCNSTFFVAPVLPFPAPFSRESTVSLVFLLLMKCLGQSFLLPFTFLAKFQSRWIVTLLNPGKVTQCLCIPPRSPDLVSTSILPFYIWVLSAAPCSSKQTSCQFGLAFSCMCRWTILELGEGGTWKSTTSPSLHVPWHTSKSAPVSGLLRSGLAILSFAILPPLRIRNLGISWSPQQMLSL